eukprot:m.119921 g.119921  ORF g.119921 m.119921 type:complete len:540 (+) comp37712_c0_seq3:120-1739(+)
MCIRVHITGLCIFCFISIAMSAAPDQRIGHESARIGDFIHLFGGRNGSKWFSRSQIHVWDIQRRRWYLRFADGADVPPPCSSASCAVIDGTIYSYGGKTRSGDRLSRVYCLDPKYMNWELVDTSQGAQLKRSKCCLCAVGSRVIMFGGDVSDNRLYKLKLFKRKKGLWKEVETEGERPRPRYGAAMVDIDKFRALLHGGLRIGFGYLNDFFVIDLAKKEWTWVTFDHQPSARSGHRLCRLDLMLIAKRGRFLLFGGELKETSDDCYILNVEEQTVCKIDKFKPICQHTVHCIQHPDKTVEILCFGGSEPVSGLLKVVMTTGTFIPRSREEDDKRIVDEQTLCSLTSQLSKDELKTKEAADELTDLEQRLSEKRVLLRNRESKREERSSHCQSLDDQSDKLRGEKREQTASLKCTSLEQEVVRKEALLIVSNRRREELFRLCGNLEEHCDKLGKQEYQMASRVFELEQTCTSMEKTAAMDQAMLRESNRREVSELEHRCISLEQHMAKEQVMLQESNGRQEELFCRCKKLEELCGELNGQ